MKRGCFVGLAGLDIVYYQDNMPSEDTKSKTNDYRVALGGPAANAAITYSLLGGKSILITSIGNSDMSRMVKQQLKEEYDIQVIDVNSNVNVLPSISNIVVNTLNGSRTIISGQQEQNYAVDDLNVDIVKDVDVVLSDCNLYDISMKVLAKACDFSKPIVLDAGSWKVNMDDYLNFATDAIASATCTPLDINKSFVNEAKCCEVKNIAITNGSLPFSWCTEMDEGTINPIEVKAVDTLGAGDVFHGAYCYFKYAMNQDFKNALINSSVIAGHSVMYKGIRKGIMDAAELLNKI